MKKLLIYLSYMMIFVVGFLLQTSCGKELPDNLSNYEVKKGGGDNGGSNNNGEQKPSDPTTSNIPSESDNPLPTY